MILYIVQVGLAIWAWKKSWGWRAILPAIICFVGQLFALFVLVSVASVITVLYNIEVDEATFMWVAIATDLMFHAGAIIAYIIMIRNPRIPVIEAEVV